MLGQAITRFCRQTPCGVTLVVSLSFTFCIHIFAEKIIAKKMQCPNINKKFGMGAPILNAFSIFLFIKEQRFRVYKIFDACSPSQGRITIIFMSSMFEPFSKTLNLDSKFSQNIFDTKSKKLKDTHQSALQNLSNKNPCL